MNELDEPTRTAVHHLTQSTATDVFTHLPDWHLVQAEDVEKGLNALIDIARAEFKTLEDHYTLTWEGLMSTMERMLHDFNSAQSRIHHLQSVCFSDNIQTAFEKVQPALVQLSLEMGQSRKLFDALTMLQKNTALTLTQHKVIENNIKYMHHQGVGLDGQDKDAFLKIQQELTKLTTEYSNHLITEAKNARIKVENAQELVGIPLPVLDAAVQKAIEDGFEDASVEHGPWHFSLDGSTYITVLKSCKNPQLREVFFKRFSARGTSEDYDNRDILQKILSLKQKKAKLLGFANTAQLSIDQKMAPNEQAVLDLIEQLRAVAQPIAHQELEELTAFAQSQDSQIIELKSWDLSFWREKYVQHYFNVDQEALRDYLQLPKVMDSLFNMMKDIFNLEITQCDTAFATTLQPNQIPTWHKDVEFYQISENGQPIAGFFMDPYARPGEKRAGAWMNNVVDKSNVLAGKGQSSSLPVALFVLNARPPQNGKPGLVSLDDVETLFHEFGHAMQHMLTRVEDSDVSGINGIEWDAVEVASQFNENWIYQPNFLKSVTHHVETGQSLDDATIDKIIQSRNYFAANDCLRQLTLALIDFKLHQDYGHGNETQTPEQIENDIKKLMLVTPYEENLSALPAFSHIFAGGYSAGYYSYKWAEVMAADAFAAFEEVGLDNPVALRAQAQKYRETILALGGSKSAGEVYREYRGRDATPDALLRHQGLKPPLAQPNQ